MGNLWHQRVVRVGVSKQRADGQKNLRNGESWRPLLLEDIKANRTIGVDVGVVDSRGKVDLRGLEGIVGWEMDVQEVNTALEGRFIGSHDGGLPVVLVLLINGTG